jgi:hypothetical protein
VSRRPPTNNERAFLDTLLSHQFEGVEALRSQWRHTHVESSCDCGCGSIGFVFEPDFEPTRSTASSPLPVEGEVVDADGDVVGGIIVLVRDGLLDDVDVHAYGQAPMAFPAPGSIRWRKRSSDCTAH